MSFTIGSLFDGSGGFPLAAFMAGGVPVWASEIEPYPIAVTKSRFPYVKHLGSVTDINGAEIDPVDVISFGSPCQDLSVAGKRAGLKHEVNGDEETTRSGLFMEAVRIIKEMREKTNGVYPRIAVWENVPGAFSSNKGEDFRIVCEELIKIVEPSASMPPVPKNGWAYSDCYVGDGWSLAYRVFDAQHWGVPQRRRRIYLVADFGGQRAGKVLFKRDGVRGYFETGRTPWQATPAYAQRGAGTDDREGYDSIIYAVDQGGGKSGANVLEGMAPTLYTTHGGEPAVAYSTSAEQYLFENHSQDTRYKGPLDVAPIVSATFGMGGNNQPFVVEPFCKSARARSADDATTWKHGKVANTLNTFDMGETRANELVVESVPVPIHDQATRFSGKRGDKSDGKGNGFGVGNPGDPMNTLTSGDRHAVAYAMQGFGDYKGSDQASSCKARDYKDATDLVVEQSPCRSPQVYRQGGFADYVEGEVGTLRASGGDYGGGTENILVEQQAIRYIVRRLTPTECARLQGFPDKWGHPDRKDDLTDEEYQFWLNVRNTHAAINGKATKDHTKQQMLTWYNKLHTDSSEYKMWGNGIALPNALYVMQGIAEVFGSV